MEYINKFTDLINTGGETVLSTLQLGGYFIITISAYVDIFKMLQSKDLAKIVSIVLKNGGLIFVLYKSTDFFKWMSNF